MIKSRTIRKVITFRLNQFNSSQKLHKMLFFLKKKNNNIAKIKNGAYFNRQNFILDFKSSVNLNKSLSCDKFLKGYFSHLCWNLTIKRPKDVYDRMLRISTKFVGYRFRIYNGRIYRLLLVNSNHIGFRFGEFAFTRRFGLGSELHMRRKKKTK